MATNQFLPFATQPGANVVTQASYAADPATGAGFSAGIALSAKLNKVWRQSSFVSAGLAEFIMRHAGQDVLDNGNLGGFADMLETALLNMRAKDVVITTTANYYVSATRGSDFNDGTSSATPWRTIQHAIDWLIDNVDANGNTIIVNCEDGNYGPLVMTHGGVVGTGPDTLILRGNLNNPNACIIDAQNTVAVWLDNGAALRLEGFHLQASGGGVWGGSGIVAAGSANIHWQAIDFGVCSWAHILVAWGGLAQPMGSYSISGNAVFHFKGSGNTIALMGGVPTTISIIGNLTFSGAFITLDGMSYFFGNVPNITFTGSGNVTGPKHWIFTNAVCDIPNATINFFPGQLTNSVPQTANTMGNTGGVLATSLGINSREAFERMNLADLQKL